MSPTGQSQDVRGEAACGCQRDEAVTRDKQRSSEGYRRRREHADRAEIFGLGGSDIGMPRRRMVACMTGGSLCSREARAVFLVVP